MRGPVVFQTPDFQRQFMGNSKTKGLEELRLSDAAFGHTPQYPIPSHHRTISHNTFKEYHVSPNHRGKEREEQNP